MDAMRGCWLAVSALLLMAAGQQTIEFRADGTGSATGAVTNGATGARYTAALVPENNMSGDVLGIALTLCATPCVGDLLAEQAGPGMRPFLFSARDFAKGPAGSALGADREMAMPEGRAMLHIKVVRSEVVAGADTKKPTLTFKDLALALSIGPAR